MLLIISPVETEERSNKGNSHDSRLTAALKNAIRHICSKHFCWDAQVRAFGRAAEKVRPGDFKLTRIKARFHFVARHAPG